MALTQKSASAFKSMSDPRHFHVRAERERVECGTRVRPRTAMRAVQVQMQKSLKKHS